MIASNRVLAGEIRDRARHLANTIVTAGAESEPRDGSIEQAQALAVERAVARHQRRRELHIRAEAVGGIPRLLAAARRDDAGADGGGWFAGLAAGECRHRQRADLDEEIEAV